MTASPYAPRAKLRLQFHRGFMLDDAVRIVDWAADLGIGHIYALPLLTARAADRVGRFDAWLQHRRSRQHQPRAWRRSGAPARTASPSTSISIRRM
jgi:hypothetical protein